MLMGKGIKVLWFPLRIISLSSIRTFAIPFSSIQCSYLYLWIYKEEDYLCFTFINLKLSATITFYREIIAPKSKPPFLLFSDSSKPFSLITCTRSLTYCERFLSQIYDAS